MTDRPVETRTRVIAELSKMKRPAVFLGMGLVLASIASGQSESLKLVNLETPNLPAPGQYDFAAQFRAFGGSDRLTYGTVEANAGLSRSLGLILRSSFSRVQSFSGAGSGIMYGGGDIEAQLKYQDIDDPHLAFMGGVSLPNTPAHHSMFGTGAVVYGYPLNQITLYGEGKGLLGANSAIGAFGGGVDYRLGRGFHVVGDAELVISGDNDYSTETGLPSRGSIYGAALRYVASGRLDWSADLGVTNALGGTTGFELTPSLGATAGFYLGMGVRF